MTGESSEPLSTVVKRRASIAAAPLASDAVAASFNATRGSVGCCAVMTTAHDKSSAIPSNIFGNLMSVSPSRQLQLVIPLFRIAKITDLSLCYCLAQIRFSARCARAFDFFSLAFASPGPPTLIRKNKSFFSTYSAPPTRLAIQ